MKLISNREYEFWQGQLSRAFAAADRERDRANRVMDTLLQVLGQQAISEAPSRPQDHGDQLLELAKRLAGKTEGYDSVFADETASPLEDNTQEHLKEDVPAASV